MKTNINAVNNNKTHEGGRAGHQTPKQELERTVASTLLFEKTFYEDGESIAKRIADLCNQVGPEFVADLAVKARKEWNLRHVPLFLLVQLDRIARGRTDKLISRTVFEVIQRPDEVTELVSLLFKYANDGKRRAIPNQIKDGINRIFNEKFDEYQWAKWLETNGLVKHRDVMRMTRPKPISAERNDLLHKIRHDGLKTPDTWEVGLSAAGSDPAAKRAVFERLLDENKMPYMATLKNLRNMISFNVPDAKIRKRLLNSKGNRNLPFEFLTAARYAPQFVGELDKAMLSNIEGMYKLSGTTLILVDVSGSMSAALSYIDCKGQMKSSETRRIDVASALAIIARECGDNARVFKYDSQLYPEVPAYRGMALEKVLTDRWGGATYTAESLRKLQGLVPHADRLIVITDEQSHDGFYRGWAKHNYLLNVAPYKPALDTSGGWVRFNGFSDRFVDWMVLHEQLAE